MSRVERTMNNHAGMRAIFGTYGSGRQDPSRTIDWECAAFSASWFHNASRSRSCTTALRTPCAETRAISCFFAISIRYLTVTRASALWDGETTTEDSHAQTDQTPRRRCGRPPHRVLCLGQRDPGLRAAGAAEWADKLRGPVSRRTPLPPDQPWRRHGPDLRTGPQPRHLDRRRRAQWHGPRRRAGRSAQGHHCEGAGRAVRDGTHRDPREGQHREGISPEPRTLHPAGTRPDPGHGRHPGRRCEIPPRPPPHPLSGEPLPRGDLQDVQPRRDVGPASGRDEPAQAHPQVPRGKARALPECGGAAADRRGAARDGRGGDRTALSHPRRAAPDPVGLPAERDHDAAMGPRRPGRPRPAPAGLQDRRQARPSRPARR